MAVAYDNSTTAHGFSVTSVTTGAFTISGTNRAALVGVEKLGATSGTTASVGGVSAARVTSAFQASVGGTFNTDMFACAAPPTGSQTATVSWTGAVSCSVGVISFTGVDQTTPAVNGLGADGGFGTTASVTITSSSGDMTATVVGTGGPDTTASTNQTKRTTDWGSMDTGPGTGSTTHTWTDGPGNQYMTVSGASMKAVSGGGGTTTIAPDAGAVGVIAPTGPFLTWFSPGSCFVGILGAAPTISTVTMTVIAPDVALVGVAAQDPQPQVASLPQVLYDNSATVHGFGVTSLSTGTFAIGSNASRAAVCGLFFTGSISGLGVTVGGVAASAAFNTAVQNGIRTELWCAVNPPTGSQTASASWTGAVSASLGVITASGVDQTLPTSDGLFANPGFGSQASLSVPSLSGDLTISLVGTSSPTTTAASNQTKRTTDWGAMDTGGGAGFTTHIWTDVTNQVMVASGVNLRAANNLLIAASVGAGALAQAPVIDATGADFLISPTAGIGGALGMALPIGSTSTTVIDPARKVDFSLAGAASMPNRTTIFQTLAAGSTAAQINSAIVNCPAGQVVKLSAGSYNIGAILLEKSNITLRGAGPDQTFITFSSGAGPYGPWANITLGNGGAPSVDNPGTVVNWTAGYAKGTTTITLASVAGLAIGAMLVLDQNDDSDTDTGEIWVNDNLASSSEGGAAGRPGRCQMQFVKVTAISGNQVTFTPGLYMPNWRASQAPQAWWINTPAEGIGIEDLSMDHYPSSSFADSGILMLNARECWVKNVRSMRARRNHIYLFQAAHITVRDSYFYGSPGTSQSYGIETRMGSDHLIDNNIFQKIASPMMNGNVTGAVWANNYAVDDDYQSPPSWQQASSYFHDAGVDNVLFEGNDGIGCTMDNIHGTQHFGTALRNYWIGKEPGKTQQTTPIIVMACNRYMNFVGNVLGDPAHHSNYECAPTSANDGGVGGVGDRSIYTIGWSGNQGGRDGRLPNDVLVKQTMLRWGNWDTVTQTARFQASEVPSALAKYANPIPAGTGIPVSEYTSSRPSPHIALGVPWPAIGPDVTGGNVPNLGGHVYKIPARLCFEQGTFTGGILNFNAKFYDLAAALTAPAGYAAALSGQAPTVVATSTISPDAGYGAAAASPATIALAGVVPVIKPDSASVGVLGQAPMILAGSRLTFAEFLAADDRDPIVLVELHPSVVVSGWTPQQTRPLMTAPTLGTLRNDFTGCVGFKFAALSALTITALGRWKVAGNAQTHTLRLMQESSTGALTTLATVSVNLATGSAGAIVYANLATPVQLVAGGTYHIFSSETAGGDSWYAEDSVISPASGAQGVVPTLQTTCGAAAYTQPATVIPNHSYGPLSALTASSYALAFPRFFGTDTIPGGVYRRVDGVRINDVDLVRGTGSTTLAAGQWWYDEANDQLWVAGDAAPDSYAVVQVFVTIFAATTGLILDQRFGDATSGVHYRPIVVGGVASVIDQAPDPILGGNITLTGQIDLMNESQGLPKLFAVDGAWRWRNKLASLYYGGRVRGRTLARPDFYPIGTVLIIGVAADE